MADDLTAYRSTERLADQYGEQYFRHYSHAGNEPYRRTEPVWPGLFRGMAQTIVATLRPQTVLDAGCAMGMLVEALRDLGVEAWGIDFSDYAIAQVRPDVRAYCRVRSVADELDRDYDLITCIEVLEHLDAGEADLAVANFARHADMVLLSSTPDDYQEPTHLNVQPTDYWVGLFARHGLYRDLDFDAYFVSQHAMLFRRQPALPIDTLRAYERQLRQARSEIRELRARYQSSINAQRLQETDLEHHQIERGLLSGEVAHWEWRTGVVSKELDASRQRNGVQDKVAARVKALARLAKQAHVPAIQTPRPIPAGAKRVLFISDGADGSRRYRCDHQAEALRLNGWSADVVTYADNFGSLTPYVHAYDAFVLQRLPLRPSLEVFIHDVREQKKPLVYDIDDLIFDPDLAAHWAPFGSISDAERWSAKHGMWRNRQAMAKCDAIVVPTEPLRTFAQKLVERSYVVPNAVSQEMLSDAASVVTERHQLREVTLAYFSGTPTHDRDVGHIGDALRWALDSYLEVRLLFVGPVALPVQLLDVRDRVECLDLVPWRDLPRLFSRVAINLAPLEPDNPFTESKSCLKYLEAGLVGVPSIASPRRDFSRVIRHRENGLLAESVSEWQSAVRDLIESPALREQLGRQARDDVLRSHTTSARGAQLQRVVLDLVADAHGSPR